MCVCVCVCVCVLVNLRTAVDGDPKALFSIAKTQRCRGCYSFLWIALLYP